ncbi:alpha/beta-tubulin-N-acetyltransferase 9 [Episyrphus balteatus]|uniref:alpha/beta-tubulin-N-acetyltransferase 9 n=1 Tax=Episyrphus balteatus TaxID=286459 RepID=UPI002484FDC7|nr:alpha/beta-tubulin-N-acetyltransferase 9 [Episyrphus balteatus]
MKLNENIKIIGSNVILVPYEAKHVEKYNKWMQDPKLQELTASEPLSIEEEYRMQTSWRNDDDKLTFLVVSRQLFSETKDEIESLVGDTNLFLRIDEDEENNTKVRVAEAEIMIAEPSFRRQGLGWEAMLLLLKYAQKNLPIDKFEVKIGFENVKSINMFEKMKFIETYRTEVFKEVTLERKVTNDWISWLDEQVQLTVEQYQ